MRYIIMCGQNETRGWLKPRQLAMLNGEVLVERTIRLLTECGVDKDDITITTDVPEKFNYITDIRVQPYDSSGLWVNCFYRTNEPTCYLFGDVYYSYSAILTIVSCPEDDIYFFASHPEGTMHKKWAEPFGFKVNDIDQFFKYVEATKDFYKRGLLKRCIAWELWQVIKGTELNKIDYTNYIIIDDYTCDLDEPKDLGNIEIQLRHEYVMIHAVPERLWYVRGYLIGSLEAAGFSNITVWCDNEHCGNLEACLRSFNSLDDLDRFTWHLQDDVIFDYKNEHIPDLYNNKDAVVCGFASEYDETTPGFVKPEKMWLSFPCIGMTNRIAKGFVTWIRVLAVNDNKLRDLINTNKYDDNLFKEYMKHVRPNHTVLNLAPNLVEHVDYLIGGTVVNGERKNQHVTSKYFAHPEIVEGLEKILHSVI